MSALKSDEYRIHPDAMSAVNTNSIVSPGCGCAGATCTVQQSQLESEFAAPDCNRRFFTMAKQAQKLDDWLRVILGEYDEHNLDFTVEEAQVWGRLRVPHHENAIDKQIAATALTHGLTIACTEEFRANHSDRSWFSSVL